VPIRFHPDEAGLIGCLHLAPSWIFEAHDSILAVDIGGTNIRCGVVETRWKKAPDLSKASGVEVRTLAPCGRRADAGGRRQTPGQDAERPDRGRDAGRAQACPFIGIACPGVINDDGSIEKRRADLPGHHWQSSQFNLPASLVEAIQRSAITTPRSDAQ